MGVGQLQDEPVVRTKDQRNGRGLPARFPSGHESASRCVSATGSEPADLPGGENGPAYSPGPGGEATDIRLVKNGAAAALTALRPDNASHDALVFGGLNGHSIGRRFAAAARAAGVEGITAHSGRVGLASELTAAGASTTETMLAGGWKTSRMVAHYSAGASGSPHDHTPRRHDNRAYASQWSAWVSWCASRGACALPASPVELAAYLAERAEEASTSTVRMAKAAVVFVHKAKGEPSPVTDEGSGSVERPRRLESG